MSDAPISEFAYDVFICHSSKDKPTARDLTTRLKNAGLRVWFDEDIIKPGDLILSSVEIGLRSARALLLLMSRNTFDYEWSQLESQTFFFRDPGNKHCRFIPILIANCQIPNSLRQFAQIDIRQSPNPHAPIIDVLFADDPGYVEAKERIARARRTRSTSLGLRGLRLPILPPEIGELTSLWELSIWENQLTVLPPEIGQLTGLSKLDISSNRLKVLPREIGELTGLRILKASNNQLTSLPPEIGQLTSLTELNISSNKLAALPPAIGRLTSMTSLNASDNGLTTVPLEICQLTNLSRLDVSINGLEALPAEIGQLTALTHLKVFFNGLTALPPEIGRVTALTTLDLSANNLSALPPEIGQLTALKELNVSENPLTALPPEIGQLAALTDLRMRSNRLAALPPQIGQLSALHRLDLDGNRLITLPPEIGQLTALTKLILDGNQLTALPPEIGQLTALMELDLIGNQLTALPPEISRLTALTELDLWGNQLVALPPEICQLTTLKALYLHGNDDLGIPVEILGPTTSDVLHKGAKPASPHTILDYYFRALTASYPLNEAKMILVGRGEVGKTSLVKRLLTNTFNPRQSKTQGIQIEKWALSLHRREKVQLNIWDFGGQEIMHATHQFFLTKRSLYLVVLNGREGGEDLDAEYWLKTISTLAPDSPVIVVLNKYRQHPFDLNRRALQAKYPNIRAFVETDCANHPRPLGISKLKSAIKCAVDKDLPELRTKFPASWASIKNALSAMKDNFLSFERYRELCANLKETDPSAQNKLASHLHDLGIALNYKDDPRLSDKHVLNPRWVTNGIYKILNAPKLTASQGVLDLADVPSILDPKTYPKEMHHFLLELMRKFELCFPFPDNDTRYLIPELLGKNEPENAAQFINDNVAQFRYKYEILPEGLIPRFIMRTYVHSEEQPRWRFGVILKFEGNLALVRADIQTACVHIYVSGPVDSRRRLLAVIRSHFDHIHSLLRLTPQARVPVSAVPGLVLAYDDLLTYEKSNEITIKIPFNGQLHSIDIRILLNGIDIEGARMPTPRSDSRPPRLFYSYSSKDEELRQELETQLTLLKRLGKLDTWHMRMIPPGKEWEKAIDENLKSADIILLLVSPDFLASDYCWDVETKFAMQQHDAGQSLVIPIIVRACDWQQTGCPFAKLQALPTGAKPIKPAPDRDTVWASVAEAIRKHLESIRRPHH